MKLNFRGGCREVGETAIEINDKILLDCGINIEEDPPKYPVCSNNLDVVLLSHAHLDHSGALPTLYKKNSPKFVTNIVTRELVNLLLKDSMKITRLEHYPKRYGKKDLKALMNSSVLKGYNQRFKVKNYSCTYLDAGHIPGSSGVIVDGKKRLFYTGDINTQDTELLSRCVLPKNTDVLITESTYSYKDHPPRDKEKKRFLKHIKEIIANNDTALIPVFAVGRSQEMLLALEDYADKIALDGMAKTASYIIEHYKGYLKDRDRLARILKKITWIRDHDQRKKAVDKFPIILSTAGMLFGGPILYYIEQFKNDENARILFTGFLVEDSPGRNLIQSSRFKKGNEEFEVKCKLEQFDFSAHAGQSGLLDIIEKTQPEKVICVHGDRCKKFAGEIQDKYDIDGLAPKNGEVLTC